MSINLKTSPYPGFPTDLQAQLMVLLCKSKKISTISEEIFENTQTDTTENAFFKTRLGQIGNCLYLTILAYDLKIPILEMRCLQNEND